MFTLDTETGFKDVVVINSAYGLGEAIVQGTVNPDEFIVYKNTLKGGYKPIISKYLSLKEIKMVYSKNAAVTTLVEPEKANLFSISDNEVLELAKMAITIEDYYTELNNYWSPMDIEWAKDGIENKIYIVQARPETVHSQKSSKSKINMYSLKNTK